jgi:hypothetical protein
VQCGMFYMHRYEQSGEHTLLSTRLLTPMHVKHTILHIQLSPEDESMRFETCWRKEKLNIHLKKYVFLWFLLYSDMQL